MRRFPRVLVLALALGPGCSFPETPAVPADTTNSDTDAVDASGPGTGDSRGAEDGWSGSVPPATSEGSSTGGPSATASSATDGETFTGTTFDPSASGTTFDPSGTGTTFDPSTTGTTFDPSGTGTTFDPSGTGTTFDPSGTGTTFDPSTTGTTFDPSTTGTTFDPSGTGTTFDPSTTGGSDSDSGGISLDVGGGVDPTCPMDCAPPCDLVVSEGLGAVASLRRDDVALAARDVGGKVAVFDAASLATIYVEPDTEWMDLAAGTLATAQGNTVTLRSSVDAGVYGVAVTEASRGLADDGSYLWSAGPGGLEVFDLLGLQILWLPGDFSNAVALALPDSIHVFSPTYAAQSVVHVDLASAFVDEVPFEGSFAGWFGGVPRFWSTQGMAYRLYAVDGTELSFDVGTIHHGYGDYLWASFGLVHISDLTTPLPNAPQGTWRASGRAIASYDAGAGTGSIVVLDPGGPQVEAFPLPCCTPTGAWRFAWDATGWALGQPDGRVTDDLGRPTSLGPIARLTGSLAGRAVLQTDDSNAEVWDTVDDCTFEMVGDFARPSVRMELSPDGSALASWEQQGFPIERGTRMYSVPAGLDLGFFAAGAPTNHLPHGWNLADDGSLVGQMWEQTQYFDVSVFAPFSPVVWPGDNGSNVLPAIAPSGLRSVVTDTMGWGPGSTYEGSVSYVYEAGAFTDVFDGVTWGFLDETHLLVSYYDESAMFCSGNTGTCDIFLGSDITGLDGVPIVASPLPDVRNFQRINDTEIFVLNPPRIYDAYSGAQLWSMPNVADAAPLDEDRVIWSDGDSLVIHRWR
jgi:hypothetical protein